MFFLGLIFYSFFQREKFRVEILSSFDTLGQLQLPTHEHPDGSGWITGTILGIIMLIAAIVIIWYLTVFLK